MADIQAVYGSGMEAGQVGLISRPNAPYNGERIQIGATGLKPGAAFKLNGSGKAIPMAGEDDASRVEGVLGYEASMMNNASGYIADYAVNQWVPYIEEGYVYGVAGEAIDRGEQVAYDPADGKWYGSTLADVDQQKILTCATGATSGELFEVKVGERVAPNADTDLQDQIDALVPMSHDAAFTIGTESNDVIKVTAQLTDAEGTAVTGVQVVDVLLSDAATGIGLVATATSGTVVIAAKGTLLASPVAKKLLTIQTDANGQFDLNITEAGTKTLYVAVILMDGTIAVSDAVTFAA